MVVGRALAVSYLYITVLDIIIALHTLLSIQLLGLIVRALRGPSDPTTGPETRLRHSNAISVTATADRSCRILFLELIDAYSHILSNL